MNQNTIFNARSFAIGGDVNSFYGFYTAHQVIWESKRFCERQLFCHTGPLYELFYWRFMTDKGMHVNLMLDREYSFRSYMGSFLEVKDSPTEYLDIHEEHRRSLTTKQFYAEQPKFFEVLAHPIKGMQAYSKNIAVVLYAIPVSNRNWNMGLVWIVLKNSCFHLARKQGAVDYAGLRQSKLVDKNDFIRETIMSIGYSDGELGSRDTSLPF